MAYEARRDDDLSKEEEKARSDSNNAQAVRTLTAAGKEVPEAHVQAVARGLDIASKVTGGKSDELIGKALTRANNIAPGGKLTQNATNKAMESGAGQAAAKGVSLYNSAKGGGAPNETPNQVKKPGDVGGEQGGSLPSSGGDKNKENVPNVPKNGESSQENKPSGGGEDGNEKVKEDSNGGGKDDSNQKDDDGKSKASFIAMFTLSPVFIMIVPGIIIVIMLIMMLLSITIGDLADYEDAFGISSIAGMDTGGVNDITNDPDKLAFYNKVKEITLEYQEEGKTVNPLLVVSVFHALNVYDAHISYRNITDEEIKRVIDAMFVDNTYSETQFKNNLKNDIIPSYLPNATSGKIDLVVNEVFDYIRRYEDIIGKNRRRSSNCSSPGSCTYDISGFYIQGSGNVTKELNVSDIYVRLMQCGDNYGGTYGEPLAGEELIPFEKYILGVAYAEIGPSAPEHAFKAQMIAARSYILARPTQMGGWRTLKEENGKWVLQVASCTADQVYCDPDRGCSSTDGQWSMVHSGPGYGRTLHGPIEENSPLRQYAADVQGEVLVNNQGYVILTGYVNTESNQFISLARSGYDYKQILLQVYNQGNRNYGAYDINKASCGGCVSNGSYASWKQYEGDWVNVTLGTSGRSISQIGCLATSVAIQIARSGVNVNVSDFNPGTFVEYLNSHGGFASTGDFNWDSASSIAPSFAYQGKVWLEGMTRAQKLEAIRNLVSQPGVYVVAEVKGNTGQHWVAIDSVDGNTVNMMDPGSTATDMWSEYNWVNTSQLAYYKVS